MEHIIFLVPLIIPLTIFFLIFGVLYKVAKKTIKNQSRVQSFDDYQPYVSQPPSLPTKLPLKELPFVIVALIVIFIWSVFMVVGFISIDDIGFGFIIISTIVCGPLLYFLTKYHKREKTEDELYLFLNEDAIVYKGQRIPYNEIKSIYHIFRSTGHYKNRKYTHYIEITGDYDRIVIPISELEAEHWRELINCCVYHNPHLLIDKVVKDILVNRKIPALSAGTFKQVRQ